MKTFTSLKGFLSIFIVAWTINASAQSSSISPTTPNTRVGGSITFTSTITGGHGNNAANKQFTWTVLPNTTTPTGPAVNTIGSGFSNSQAFTFNAPGVYTVTVVVLTTSGGSTGATSQASTTVTVWNPNLYSTSGTGTIKAWNVDPLNGTVINGPEDLFTPSSNTAALAKNQVTPVTDPNGYLYWLPNSGTNGVVTVNAHNPLGTGASTTVATLDFNGASNTSLGFVRLAIDPFGWGWILAGDGTNLYLGKFQAKGTTNTQTTITVVNSAVIVAGGGSVADFQNGDIAFSANGTMYALANVTDGVTGIYTMNTTSQTTTLTKKWTLVDGGNDNFSGSVNGVAFNQNGSMHFSTSTGLYFINQATANGPAGTVQAVEVNGLDGLTDLASDKFPLQTTLPVDLMSFTGSLRNNIATLNWETENEVSFSHYEVERSSNGSSFGMIGSKNSLGSSNKSSYEYADDLNSFSGNVVYYRLRMVDLNGKASYSNTIMIRKDQKDITGLTLSPNPIVNNAATVRFNAKTRSNVTIRVIDMAGRVVLQQQNRVNEGANSVSVNNLERLQRGTYMIQLVNEDELTAIKFTVVR